MSDSGSNRGWGDSFYWKSRDLIMEHGLLVWTAVTILCAVGVFLAVGHFRGADKSVEIANWMQVEATILKSELNEINTSDETSFSTRMSVHLTLQYHIGSESHETQHVTSWQRRDLKDWSEIFHPGKKISIRVSPDNPGSLSLIDLTGVP